MEIAKDVSLKPYNSWAVGGTADYFAQPKSFEDLKEALFWANRENKKVTFLGDGTNVLISERGVEGLVIALHQFKDLRVLEEKQVLNIEAQAGVSKSDLFKVFYDFKLAPAVFLVGIPGNVAGGVVMNAGIGEKTFPYQFSDIVSWVEVLELNKSLLDLEKEKGLGLEKRKGSDLDSFFKVKRIPASQIQWFYRGSRGWEPGVLIKVGFSWPKGEELSLVEKVKKRAKKRFKTQPLQGLSCGSVFKNSKNYKSGALIEKVGLKGFSIQGAQVSKKHANFILNLKKQASAQDIHSLICFVREKVKEKTGVFLETEVKYLGRW